tara:strand:- start:33 stop:221 length:189 start_codon:yes stop_codon:yes gene_type:complete
MIKLFILLTFSGFTITVDANGLYGVTDMKTCQERLYDIQSEYANVISASCLIGNIEEETQKT